MSHDEDKAIIVLSDVHIGDARLSAANSRFLDFISRIDADQVAALYILGDLFDVWVGDDAANALDEAVQSALSQLHQRGIKTFIQHGNRDFMLGERFLHPCNAVLLPGAHLLQTGATNPWLLMHGDSLVNDAAYLRYRGFIRHPLLLKAAAALPLFARRYIAARLRSASSGNLQAAYLDNALVTTTLRQHNCDKLIHGHLHRYEHEQWEDDGAMYERWCLPAWEDQPGYAEIRGEDIRFVFL